MVERSVNVELDTGLQARPAARFVEEANRFRAHIFLEKDGKRINAKSIMGLMGLAIGTGEKITLIVEGADEELALKKLISMVTLAEGK